MLFRHDVLQSQLRKTSKGPKLETRKAQLISRDTIPVLLAAALRVATIRRFVVVILISDDDGSEMMMLCVAALHVYIT